MERFQSEWDMENLVKELTQGTDMENLVKELTQGMEVAKELQLQLHNVQSSNMNSHETREFLLHKIINCYDRALSMLAHDDVLQGGGLEVPIPDTVVKPPSDDSPWSLDGSPHMSDDSDKDLEASRKRKGTMPIRCTKKVQMCPGIHDQGQLGDGFSWLKYAEKYILGAIYPRGYYRCTYRDSQSCFATKQVQRSDDDPTMYEITYGRNHTCTLRPSPSNNNIDPPTTIPDPPNDNPNPLPEYPLEQIIPQTQLNIQTGFRVTTQDLISPNENPSFESFDFPSIENINHIFSGGNNLFGHNSPSLMSPVTSTSNCFPFSSPVMNNNYDGLRLNSYTWESELTPIVAAMTSASTNTSTLDVHFPFGPDFGFGERGY